MSLEDKWWVNVVLGLLLIFFGLEAFIDPDNSYIGIGISYFIIPFIQNIFGYIGIGIFFVAGGIFLIYLGISTLKENYKNEKNT